MEELIIKYFKTKYPDERYVYKTCFVIQDMFGVKGNNLYVVEFIDTKMKYPKTLELRIKESEFEHVWEYDCTKDELFSLWFDVK